MNWNALSKEKKQMLALGSIVGIGAVFAVYQFVLMPFLGKIGTAAKELEILRVQLQQADVIVKTAPQLDTDLSNAVVELTLAQDEYITPIQNPLSWVTEKVYRNARAVGLDIASVIEVNTPSVPWDVVARGAAATRNMAPRTYKPYAIQISLECGYKDLLRLVKAFEQNNPYLCISAISISSQEQTPERHKVEIHVEYPMQMVADTKDRTGL